MASIGWYGPLIDLSKASSCVGDFVQILVFVHKITPVQYKLSRGGGGGGVIRTDIQVGDDTRPYFPVSIWQKKMTHMVVAGDIILLQNVKITRFGEFIEARTVHCSSLLRLVHNESLICKGANELMKDCRVGISSKHKLQKVVAWVKKGGFGHYSAEFRHYQPNKQLSINWKTCDGTSTQDCFSLEELCCLLDASKATVHASVSEIFLPMTRTSLHESEAERMFISRRLTVLGDNDLACDLICAGCQLCGAPSKSTNGSTIEQNDLALYCQKSSNHVHVVGMIYRPFMLYVWDETKYMPLLVRNNAAELLFANIKAEKVYYWYRRQRHEKKLDQDVYKGNDSSGGLDERSKLETKLNFNLIWLILLRALLLNGNNRPLKFKVAVNVDRDQETGRFEMVSVSLPSFWISES